MELALLLTALIIAAVVLLLQIVCLVQIAGIRKFLRTPREVRPQHPQQGDRFERKNQDFRRQERRPFPDQRPHQAAPPQIDPVEKSLRDINLRLKSAEREQESARRKIHEEYSRGEPHRGRDDRNRRDNRDRDHHRGRRDNLQDRNRSGGFQQQQSPTGQQQPRLEPPFVKKETAIPPGELSVPVRQTASAGAVQDTDVSDFNADLQHGRKIIVKRRALKDEVSPETGAESTSMEETGTRPVESPTGQAVPSSPLSDSLEHREEETRISAAGPDLNTGGEISFGRRKPI
jgi:hypothetical protein